MYISVLDRRELTIDDKLKGLRPIHWEGLGGESKYFTFIVVHRVSLRHFWFNYILCVLLDCCHGP